MEKKRTKVTLTKANLAAVRELGINVSAISDAAVADAVRMSKSRAWAEQNAAAIAEHRAWIEANGTPATYLRVLKID